MRDVGISAQGVEQIKQAPLCYPGGNSGSCWGPTQDSITLVKEKLPTVDFPSTGNPPLAPPGYVLVPIGCASTPGHMHSTPVDTGMGSSSKVDPNSTFAPLQNKVFATDCVVSSTPKTVPEPTVNLQNDNVNVASVNTVSSVVGTAVTETPTVPAALANVSVASVVASSAPAVAATIVSSGVVSSANISFNTVSSSAVTSTTPAVTAPVNPTVVVKQLQPVRLRSTPWKTFREQYRRVARVNGWVTQTELVQYLILALEGPAAEVLKDFDDSTATAYDDMWKRIERRFGDVDEGREAQRKFGSRRQTDSESLQEYEQALRTLYKQGWPMASAESQDAALKSRFEDGVASLELSQYLRLHDRNSNFGETVKQARLYAATVEGAKAKKTIRFVANPDSGEDSDGQTAIINHLRVLEKKLHEMGREKSQSKPSGKATGGQRQAMPSSGNRGNQNSPIGNAFQARRLEGRDQAWESRVRTGSPARSSPPPMSPFRSP